MNQMGISVRPVIVSMMVALAAVIAPSRPVGAQPLGYGIAGPSGYSGFFGSSSMALHAAGGGEILAGGRVGAGGEFGLLAASVIVAIVISETTSNTASANMVFPVVIAISQAQGADPLVPALGATMAASMGFMLPVSTPCNAIVYGSGYVPLMKMVRYGLILDIAGAIVIITFVWFLAPYIR